LHARRARNLTLLILASPREWHRESVDDEGTFAEWNMGEGYGASAGRERVFVTLILAKEYPQKAVHVISTKVPVGRSTDDLNRRHLASLLHRAAYWAKSAFNAPSLTRKRRLHRVESHSS
jgi:hypothetical protein